MNHVHDWEQAVDGMRPSPLRGLPVAEQTLPGLLARQAATYGDKPLLRFDGLERSFAEMRDAAAVAAGTLAAAGIARGERVALMCENRIELLDFVLGCAWLGAVAVPLNTALRGAQLEHQLVNSGARVLALDSALVELLEPLDPPPALEAVWALDGVPAAVPAGYAVLGPPAAAAPLPAAGAGPGDTAAILYTSGTTGPSKGVQCPQAQFYWWGVLMGEMLEIGEDDVLYTNLPLFHTNALNAFVQALVAGATYHLGPRFSASRFWPRVAEAEATVTYLLGAMVNILVSRPPSAEDRAHAVRVALAPATPVAIFDAFGERFGVQLAEAYGSTETNAPIGVSWREQRAGWMGRVRSGFHARVVDEHDDEVPDGVAGELVLRHDPPYAFATGYFAMPEKTVEAWQNLWFHTGDRVLRDEDGWLRFMDRLKDAIRRRGENISAFEVEQVLLAHPSVSAVAVFPVASELAEDEVAAALVLEDGTTADFEALVRHCEPRLAYFAIPRYLRVVAALPLTTNGKVRKAVLREEGITGDSWDREAAGVRLRRLGSGGR
ncbi:ATP-dependent acyl-CoA ligase [Conexibacter woesei]|uniref:AMP-dependent synthetase and ligase n=1 Tax=Conexibacter woesei (strain DSM 14684 / CCUG 47730 / CIP 108061 / JCM 11494 / NBRC 100937 / ID131577) TaxID=469383 RepID=D3F2N3_CONWI|nr:ATP-dependent acyl-CoA ligase [Conexibacter woesei]ADB52299.1 AMP-dependent synthetase and ligase [Conexibacter woesei DSM 14684]